MGFPLDILCMVAHRTPAVDEAIATYVIVATTNCSETTTKFVNEAQLYGHPRIPDIIDDIHARRKRFDDLDFELCLQCCMQVPRCRKFIVPRAHSSYARGVHEYVFASVPPLVLAFETATQSV